MRSAISAIQCRRGVHGRPPFRGPNDFGIADWADPADRADLVFVAFERAHSQLRLTDDQRERSRIARRDRYLHRQVRVAGLSNFDRRRSLGQKHEGDGAGGSRRRECAGLDVERRRRRRADRRTGSRILPRDATDTTPTDEPSPWRANRQSVDRRGIPATSCACRTPRRRRTTLAQARTDARLERDEHRVARAVAVHRKSRCTRRSSSPRCAPDGSCSAPTGR